MKKTLIIISCILCVCALISVGTIVGNNWEKWFGEETPEGDVPGIDPNAGDYVEPEAPSAAAGVAIPGWTTITIPANQETVTVDFPNPAANAGKYYLTFQLRLKEGNELLYESGLVPPTKHIQTITLSRELAAGEYEAIIHVQPYKMDQAKTPTNNANVEFTLKVV